MKKTWILMLALGISFTSMAQQKRVDISPKDSSSRKAIKEVELTNEQKEKLTKINRQFKKEREAIEKDTTLTAEMSKAKIKSLQLEKQKKMRAVLTDQQWTEFETKRDAIRQKQK
jgi:uncharacterized protein HemX